MAFDLLSDATPKAKPKDKGKAAVGSLSEKGETQGKKAKDLGESNYPTPKTRKDQTVAHIAVGSERIPIAAYTISSSPHLVVHRSITGAKDGDVKTGDSWVVSSKKDGLQVARYPGTLKGTKRFAEAIGKKGNWEDAETVKETVPKDTLEIINRFLKPSIFTGSGQGYDPEKELNETIKKVRASGNGDPDSSGDDEDEPVHGPSKPRVKKPYKLEKGGKIRVGGAFGKLYPDPVGRVERLPAQDAKETASPWWVYESGDNGRPYAFGATKEEAIENAIRHAVGDQNFDRETFAVANIPDIKTLDPTDQRKPKDLGLSEKGVTQGEKAKDSGSESNYPTPSLRKGQELAHIDYTLDGKKRKIPIAAYPVESTPHLVVHRAFDVTKDGVKVESDGWVITQKDTGLRVASSYKGTLKGGRELAEEIGKHGDWKDEKTAQDTVPKEVAMAIGGLAKGQDAGNLDKAIDSVKKVEVKEAAGKTVTASEPPTWAKLRTDGYGEILDDVGPPPEFGRQGENTKPPLKRDVEDLEESFKRDRLMSDVLGIKPEDIPNLSRTGAKEANEYIGSVNLAIFNDQYRRADKLKAEKDAQKEKDKKKTEDGGKNLSAQESYDAAKNLSAEESYAAAKRWKERSDKALEGAKNLEERGDRIRKLIKDQSTEELAIQMREQHPHVLKAAIRDELVSRGWTRVPGDNNFAIIPPADKEPEGESKKAVSNDEKPYGPGWVSPKGETWESLDTETQEWLKKRRAEIKASKDKFDEREAWLKEFEKQKPDLEKRDEIGYVFSNGYVRLKDGDVVAFDEFLKTHQEDKEPKDKPANPVGQAEEVSEKEAPKAKTGKDGYITLSGKLFGRAKKSNPKGNPTPWTVEVYRGTQREYVKGRTREEAVNEALKQWRDVPVLYQGHKGPGVGILKTDAPDRRDGDKDTVVAERRPRVSEKHPKSPIKLSDYGGLQDAIQDYKQTISVPKGKKPSAEKLMGYRSAKKKSHYTPRAGRGGNEMKAAKK